MRLEAHKTYQPFTADSRFFREGHFLRAIHSHGSVLLLDPSHPNQNPNASTDSIQPAQPDDFDLSNGRLKLDGSLSYQIGFLTSGSTGEPKIFPKTEREINSEVLFLKDFLIEHYPGNFSGGKSGVKSMMVTIPLCHIYGFLWGYCLPSAMSMDVEDVSGLKAIRRRLCDSPPDVWVTVPSQIAGLLDLLPQKLDLSQCLVVVSGGRMSGGLARQIHQRFHCRILEIYGSTETGGMGYREPDISDSIELFDSVDGKIVEDCLAVASPFIQSDLLGKDGYFLTEDLGSLEGKKFQYLGRKGRIVKKNEKRIHLDQVESALISLGSIQEAIAVSFTVERNDQSIQKIGALVVLESNPEGDLQMNAKDRREPTNREAEFHISNWSKPEFLRPDQILIVPSIPRLPNGKKDYERAISYFPNRKN